MGESQSAESLADQVSRERQARPRGRKRIRAVVADDSSDCPAVVASLLRVEEDVEVVARVESGCEVIEAVTILRPELAIIDLGIGSLDALTTTSLLRSQFPSVSVILMADRDSPRIRTACQTSGAKYVIEKAKFQEEFISVLAQIKDRLIDSPTLGTDAK